MSGAPNPEREPENEVLRLRARVAELEQQLQSELKLGVSELRSCHRNYLAVMEFVGKVAAFGQLPELRHSHEVREGSHA